MTGIFIKERNVDTSTDMGKCCVKMKADLSDASTSQGAPRTTSEPLEAGERPGTDFLTVSGRNQPHPHFDLGLVASKTWRV